jgi:hypothetical protein
MGEPVNGEGVAYAERAGNVTLVATIVFCRRADVPAIEAMRGHVGTLVGRDVYDDTGAWWGKGCLVEIECPIDACVGGELWLAPGGP